MPRHALRLRALLAAALLILAVACGDSGAEETADSGDDSGGDDGVDRSDWPDSITFGAVPAAEEGSLEESYEAVVAALEEDLGIDVEFQTATDYAGVIEGMIAGNVEVAQFGPFSYVIARNNGAEIEPAGAMIEAPDAEPGYVSYGIARADNDDIDGLEDFAGRDVCFVDPGSTSGFLYPAAGLLELGIDPEDDVNPTYAGGHDASVIAVAQGECEVGFAFDEMVDSIVIAEGSIEEGEIKTVWESEVIAGAPVSVLTSLPDSLVEAIETSLIENNGDVLVERGLCPEDQVVEDGPNGVPSCPITDEGVWGYAEVEDDFYDGVRAVCEETEAPACLEL